MNSSQSQQTFTDEFAKVTRHWRTVVDAKLKAIGFTLARARAVRLLSQKTCGVTQRELADELEIETATLVRLLDGLEKQGLTERLPVQDDRRTNHIVLTKAARKNVAEVFEVVDDLRHELLKDISPQDLETATRVLQQIGRRLEEIRYS
ncbi:MarR family winged helix-turn-helix transcriptional regulator [Microvirga sp. 2MCAF38]|uniref:MarR family winged helix-turn-helix transcriptional regulator n=1 Tax=Microvirga sp. 2MCAF38 TaxID=3232989 RepID=UPI003F9D3A02